MSDPSLSAPARAAIRDGENEVSVSAASAWEITTKFRGGKASNLASISGDVVWEVFAEGLIELSSEARSLGTECVSACSSRWLRYPYKKKHVLEHENHT